MTPNIAQRLTDGEHNRIWNTLPKRMNQAVARENLLLIRKAFQKHVTTFWLMYGTLLGCVREGNFIPHDKDIDIGVYAKELDSIFATLLTLRNFGFDIVRAESDDSYLTVQKNNISTDIYVMTRDNDGWHWGDIQENDYFTILDTIPFLGHTFLGPHPIVDFLVDHYGPDWKKPKSNAQATLHRRTLCP